ncbi:hypothetical protein MNV49_005320 [Pseudohyphozyma bogoriensis]|nr:hypothetical protein MNV49_005320 [Pseudohyphozyma bogoriensis]
MVGQADSKRIWFNTTYGIPTWRDIVEEGEPGWRKTFTSIPVISLKNINGTLEERKELAKEVGKAFREVGFMYASECPGVTDELLASMFSTITEFFELPMEEKMTAHWHKSPAVVGYEPFDEAKMGIKTDLDLRESFCMSDDYLDPEQNFQGTPPPNTQQLNVWPEHYPQLRTKFYEYFNVVYPLARSLLRILALALDLEETAFEDYYTWPIHCLRAHHYVPQPPSEEHPSLGAHADFSSFTFVAQEPGSGPALEVLNLNGKWISAPPLKEAQFVVNCGDFLERATNGKFVSTVHRVFNRTGVRRYSLPFFLSPDPDSEVVPLPGCVGEDGVKFEPLSVGNHFARRLFQSRRQHPTSKWLIEKGAPDSEFTYDLVRHGIPKMEQA